MSDPFDMLPSWAVRKIISRANKFLDDDEFYDTWDEVAEEAAEQGVTFKKDSEIVSSLMINGANYAVSEDILKLQCCVNDKKNRAKIWARTAFNTMLPSVIAIVFEDDNYSDADLVEIGLEVVGKFFKDDKEYATLVQAEWSDWDSSQYQWFGPEPEDDEEEDEEDDEDEEGDEEDEDEDEDEDDEEEKEDTEAEEGAEAVDLFQSRRRTTPTSPSGHDSSPDRDRVAQEAWTEALAGSMFYPNPWVDEGREMFVDWVKSFDSADIEWPGDDAPYERKAEAIDDAAEGCTDAVKTELIRLNSRADRMPVTNEERNAYEDFAKTACRRAMALLMNFDYDLSVQSGDILDEYDLEAEEDEEGEGMGNV